MDWKLIKKRMSNMLAYDWIKIIALSLVVVLFWAVIFQTAGTGATSGQTFGLFFYYTMDDKSDSVTSLIDEKQCFSSDIFSVYAQKVVEGEYYRNTFFTTRIATHDGDMMVIDDEDGRTQGNFKIFVDSYGHVLYDYDSLVNDGKTYLSALLKDGKTIDSVILGYTPESVGFNKNAYFTDNFDMAKIGNLFLARCQEESSLNKKYPSESKKQQGIAEEYVRIQKLFENIADFCYLMQNYPDFFVSYRRYDCIYTYAVDTNNQEVKGQYEQKYAVETVKKYGVNTAYLSLNTNASKIPVTNYFNMSTKPEGQNKIYLLCYNYKDYQKHEQYESLAFINMIVKECSTLLDSRR